MRDIICKNIRALYNHRVQIAFQRTGMMAIVDYGRMIVVHTADRSIGDIVDSLHPIS